MTVTPDEKLYQITVTLEQLRYLQRSVRFVSRTDRKGAAKIERKFNEPVKDKSLLRRLALAEECRELLEIQ